jgi:hypothetical protein
MLLRPRHGTPHGKMQIFRALGVFMTCSGFVSIPGQCYDIGRRVAQGGQEGKLVNRPAKRPDERLGGVAERYRTAVVESLLMTGSGVGSTFSSRTPKVWS